MATYTSAHTGAEIDLAVGNANLMLLTGAADPDITTVGTLGQLYQNTTDGTLFRCSAVGATYTWVELADYSPTTAVNTLTETAAGKVLDARQGKTLGDKIGAQTYTEDNYVTDGESTTASIDALDMAVKDNADLISTNCDVAIPNLILNGSFESDDANWTTYPSATPGSIDSAVKLLGTKSMKLAAVDATAAEFQQIDCTSGDKFYYGGWVRRASGSGCIFYALPKDALGGSLSTAMSAAVFDALTAETWAYFSSVATTNNAGIRIVFGRAAVQTFVANFDGILAVNLTLVFGAGNEPTKAEMDYLVGLVPNNWWDGTLLPSQKLLLNWQLKMIRANTAAIAAL